MRIHASPRLLLLLLVPLLVSCATLHAPKVPDLPEAEPDPLLVLGIAFPTGVAVRASVITSRDAGLSWQVFACAEHENVVGFMPSRDVDYVNLYLVRQMSVADASAAGRYLVAELWRYRPAAGIKICHRWVIWGDDPGMPPSRAEYAVLIEDFQNLVLNHRAMEIEVSILERLADFHALAVEFFTTHPPGSPGEEKPVT